MNAAQLADLLLAFLDADDLADLMVRTFEDAMVLTSDAGLVVRTADGAEFQVTVVQSREAIR